MTSKTLATGAAVAALGLFSATAALAQAAGGASPAAAAIRHGAPIPGVCVLSLDAAIANSLVGKYADGRMQQIAQQVQAELAAEQAAIQAEDKALGAQRATMAPDAFDKRVADLQLRVNTLQRKAELRNREMQATQQQVRGRLGQEVEPLALQAYQAKGCSILIDGGDVIVGNPAMDLTGQVTTELNAKITQFAFDRVHLDQPAGAPAPIQTPGAAGR